MNSIKADKSKGIQEFRSEQESIFSSALQVNCSLPHMSPVILPSHFRFSSGVLLHLIVLSCLKASNRDVSQGLSIPASAIPDMKKGIKLLFLY